MRDRCAEHAGLHRDVPRKEGIGDGLRHGHALDRHLFHILIAEGASTTSAWQSKYHLNGTFAPIASWDLLYQCVKSSEELGIKVVVGNVLSEDAFYVDYPEDTEGWRQMGVLALEMEAAALYMNAARDGKKALAMFSISDEILTGVRLSSAERETGFTNMMELALDTALKL